MLIRKLDYEILLIRGILRIREKGIKNLIFVGFEKKKMKQKLSFLSQNIEGIN